MARNDGKWKDEYVLTIYELVRSGSRKVDVAKILDVNINTLDKWIVKYPLLKLAIKRAKGHVKKNSVQSYLDYVYERLPPDLQETFDRIEEARTNPSAIGRMEAMLQVHGRTGRQHLMLHALVKYNFDVSQACSSVNISVKTFRSWLLQDYEFSELIKEMEFHKKNFFESALVNLVREGDPAAIIFANRTLNKDRGYVDAKEVTVNGKVEVNHNMIDMDSLELDMETRKKVLEAVRLLKEKNIQQERAEQAAITVPFRLKSIELVEDETHDGSNLHRNGSEV
jgi:hypothetical protein